MVQIVAFPFPHRKMKEFAPRAALAKNVTTSISRGVVAKEGSFADVAAHVVKYRCRFASMISSSLAPLAAAGVATPMAGEIFDCVDGGVGLVL